MQLLFFREKPDVRTVQAKLVEKYGDDIVVSTKDHHKTVFCFRNTGYNVLAQAWHDNKKKDPTAEKLRIIKLAADIIREDVRSISDATTYPPSDNFLGQCQSVIPDSLTTSLEGK